MSRMKIFIPLSEPWFNPDRCGGCGEYEEIPLDNGRGAICSSMEAEKPCKVTGIRYYGD
jgi:hypothetical protein